MTLSESWALWGAATESEGESSNFSQRRDSPQNWAIAQMAQCNPCTQESCAKSNNNHRGLLKQKKKGLKGEKGGGRAEAAHGINSTMIKLSPQMRSYWIAIFHLLQQVTWIHGLKLESSPNFSFRNYLVLPLPHALCIISWMWLFHPKLSLNSCCALLMNKSRRMCSLNSICQFVKKDEGFSSGTKWVRVDTEKEAWKDNSTAKICLHVHRKLTNSQQKSVWQKYSKPYLTLPGSYPSQNCCSPRG